MAIKTKNSAKFKAGEKNVVDLAASIFKGEVILKQQTTEPRGQ